MEGNLAAATSEAGVALSTAVDAHSTAARRLMHFVDGLSISIVNLEARDAAVALLLDLDRGNKYKQDGIMSEEKVYS
jgi:hypothetical protein